MSFTNTSATDTEFLLALSTNVVVGVPASEGGRIFVDNIRYYDASGNLAGRPCDAEAIQRCQALTPHPLYVASPQTIDGVTYQPGCYEHESCVSDTPIIGFLEEFACEDPFLASIVLTSTVLMIGGVLWVGPRLVALVPSLSSSAGALLAAEGSGGLSMGVSGPQLALGVAVAVMTIAATAYELPVIPDMPSIPAAESLEALGAVPEYLFDAITGTLTQSGDSAVDLVYERVDAEATLPPGLSPEEQSRARKLAKYAIGYCLATEVVAAMEFLATSGAAPFIIVDEGVNHHFCEFTPIYVPGGGTWRSGAPMGQQTIHIREALFDEPVLATEAHTGAQPPLPRPEWQVLHQRPSPGGARWYAASPFNCGATLGSGNGCDEFPWKATDEGVQSPRIVGHDPVSGRYQPHLRIIRTSHNRNGGSDLGSFYAAAGYGCGVQLASTGGAFLVVPLPREMIVSEWSPSGTTVNALNRSLRVCGIPLP